MGERSNHKGDNHMKMDDGIRLLEEKHVMHILDFIGSNPDCMKTEIYKAVSHNPRIPDKLKKLVEAGLVTATINENCTRYTLSDDGARIRELVAEISTLLERDRPAPAVI